MGVAGAKVPRSVWGLAALAVAGLAVSCNSGIPFSYTFDVAVGEGFALDGLPGMFPGDPIPEDQPFPPIPVCTLPTEEDMRDMVREAAGGFIASVFEIDRLELKTITLNATEGGFDGITEMTLLWQPLGLLPWQFREIGAASDPAGFQESVVLVPPAGVDFLDLIEDAKKTAWLGCPSVRFDVKGVVPETLPVWNVSATVRAVGHVGW